MLTVPAAAALKGRARVGWLAAAASAGVAVGLLATRVVTPKLALVAAVGLLGAAAVLVIPETGLLGLAFVTYLNLSSVLAGRLPGPSLLDLMVPALVLVVLGRWMVWRERPTGWGVPALLLAAYGLAGTLSLLAARDPGVALAGLAQLAKTGIVAILVVVLLRRGATLRRLLWALLAAGLVMAAVSVHQHLSGNFAFDYWGLAGPPTPYSGAAEIAYRVAGPIGNPNFYGMVLVTLVPIAVDRLTARRGLVSRMVALAALVVCMLAIVFTYSRGALLALLAVLAFLALVRRPRPRHLLAALLLAALLSPLVPSVYLERMRTLTDTIGHVAGDLGVQEQSMRGRLSENLAAVQMFLDHPWVGVGLGNYSGRYQDYSQRLLIDPRSEARASHNLYLEVAAETGILGLLAFAATLWVLLRSIVVARRSLGAPELAEVRGMVDAVAIALVGFLVGSVFLHAGDMKHFWLLAGIVLALPGVAASEQAALDAAGDRHERLPAGP